ncbi:MAG: lysophospholipid acyltransferase family protein, partial [Epsilonproteobacteria bacterium]|nr:lysophospholipid acyltransferase family protein [Campylobacterota bacterium]
AFYLYKIFGYRFFYYLLYPITFFYFIVAKNAKDGLRVFYEHLDLPFTNRRYYEHLRMFAVCMVDRFAAKINPENYSFEYDNIEIPTKILESGTVLVYSHFGGWAASSSGAHVNNKIHIVMQEVMLDSIKKIENSLERESNINVIDLNQGTIAVSVQIANALMREEVVAIMADRASNEKAEIEILFLNEKARFNKNPFQVAYKVDKPILVYFIIWVGIQRYKIEYIKIDMDKNKPEGQAIEEALTLYVKKFEEIVKAYPSQWFNLYNFWEKK